MDTVVKPMLGTEPAAEKRLLHYWLLAFLALGILWRVVRYLLQFPVWATRRSSV